VKNQDKSEPEKLDDDGKQTLAKNPRQREDARRARESFIRSQERYESLEREREREKENEKERKNETSEK